MRRRRSSNNIFDSNSRRWIRIISGCILIVIGIVGFAHSLRTAIAQASYHRAKHTIYEGTRYERHPPADPVEILRICERTTHWYSANYYLTDLAAERALEGALAADNLEDFDRLFSAAEYWNNLSIAINPYSIDAMHIKARILVEQGAATAAADFWRDTVLEREFWNPERQEQYINLLLEAGQTTRAIEAATFLRRGALKTKIQKLQQQRQRNATDET